MAGGLRGRKARAIIMARGVSPHWGGILLACAMLLGLSVRTPAARAAAITWERTSPFQGCLAADLDKWLQAQVDVLTNEDPATWRLDDMAVAKWTIDVLAACKARAGGGDKATESRFTQYMAQWREHVQDLVDSVRQQSRPD
jgi:hypothetical protein